MGAGKISRKKISAKPRDAGGKIAERGKIESWDQVPRSAWNRWFTKLYAYCQAKPDAREDHPWGEIVFKVGDKGKVFAFLGMPDRAGVCVKATEEDFDAWLSLDFVKIAPYIGRFGWVVISVSDARTLKLALAGIDKSYAQIAPKPRQRGR